MRPIAPPPSDRPGGIPHPAGAPWLEPGGDWLASLRDLPRALDPQGVANSFVAILFSITGPLLVLLGAAERAGLRPEETAAWVFSTFAPGGLIGIVLALRYRQPLAMTWTLPGPILIAAALPHLTLPEVWGACLASGLLLVLAARTGWAARALAILPLPVIQGMIAGVLLRFGIDLVGALHAAPLLAGPPILLFLLASGCPGLARRFPPILLAIGAGFAMAALTREWGGPGVAWEWAWPRFAWPIFRLRAIAELSLPLALSALSVHIAQGGVLLRAVGYRPPVNALTLASGIGTVISACFGGHATVASGPVTGILVSGAADPAVRDRRYAAAVVYGCLRTLFGLASPLAGSLARLLPLPLIQSLAGMALVGILAESLAEAFSGEHRLAALLAFLTILADPAWLGVGAPFWALLGGFLLAFLQRRGERRAAPSP